MKNARSRDTEDEEKNVDRLSDLPDCVILHILSFLDTTKDVVQTCILSKRWTDIWKHLPNLILTSSQYKTVNGFDLTNKFLYHVLSHRDSSTSLHRVIIHRNFNFIMDPRLIETIVEYAVSHNVQQLEFNFKCDIQSFPPCLFSSDTLTSLQLWVAQSTRYSHKILFPNSLHLPALTILALRSFCFSVGNDGHVEPFSALKKLKSLILYECEVIGEQNLCISSTTLVRLRVSTFQTFGIVFSTPSLREFHFNGVTLPKLCESKSNLPNITHVSINFRDNFRHSLENALVLHKWLVELANIQSLRVNSVTLEILSMVPGLLKTELPSLCNLKSLKVRQIPESFIPDGIVDFLRRQSRSAKLKPEPRAHESRSYKCWILQKRHGGGISDADVCSRETFLSDCLFKIYLFS